MSTVQDMDNSMVVFIPFLLIPLKSVFSKCNNYQMYVATRLTIIIQHINRTFKPLQRSFFLLWWFTLRSTTGQRVDKKRLHSAQPQIGLAPRLRYNYGSDNKNMMRTGGGGWQNDKTGKLQTLIHCGHGKTRASLRQTKLPTWRVETGMKSHSTL